MFQSAAQVRFLQSLPACFLLIAGSVVIATPASAWPGAEQRIEDACVAAERAAAKNDPKALALLHDAVSWTQRLDQGDDRLRTAVQRIAKTRRSALLRDHANYVRSWLLGTEGKWEEKAKAREQLGLLKSGWLVGPFDNSSGGGHGTSFPPEHSADLSAVMPGKSQPLRWRTLTGVAPYGVIDIGALLHDSRDSSAYVLALINSKQKRQAALRLGSPGRTKVFVNGALVHSDETRRKARFDQDAIPIVLRRGDNVVVVKSSWTGRPSSVTLRVTHPNGSALSGLSFVDDPARVAKIWTPFAEAVLAPAKHKVVGVLDGVSAQKDPSLWARTVRAFQLVGEAVPSPAEQALEAAIAANPKQPEPLLSLAQMVATRDGSRAQDLWQRALKLDAKFAPAALRLGAFAEAAGRVDDARGWYQRVIRDDPKWTTGWFLLSQLDFDRLEAGYSALQRLAKAPAISKSPRAQHLRARMRMALNDRQGARKDAQAALQADASYEAAHRTLITLDLDAGKTDAAVKRLRHLIDVLPWRMPLALDLMRIESGRSGGLANARSLGVQLAERFPEQPRVPLAQAEVEILANDEPQALAFLERALAIDAHQPQVRQRRRALSGQRQELEDLYALDVAKLAALEVGAAEKAAGGAIVADQKVIRLYKNGKSARFVEQIVRLGDARLERALRAYTVAYAPSREAVRIIGAHRIEANGRRTPASRIGDRGMGGKVSGMYVDQRYKVIVFDALAPGDVVHLRYRVDSIGSNIFGGFFGDVTPMQSGLPKLRASLIAVSPKERPLYAGLLGMPEPTRSSDDDNVVLRWDMKDVPPLRPEPRGPPYPEIGKMVSLSTYKTWNELGRWYGPLFSQQLRLDDTARAAARKVTAGAKSNEEKIKRLYDYVVKNTRYVGIELGIHGWKPFEAAETHRRRYGDCKDKSTLLTALLRDQGIDATLTLVRTRDRGVLPEGHATMWAFNHAITYVPESKLYLDPTAEFSGTTELPQLDQDAMALVVFDDGRTQLTRLPRSASGDNTNISNYRAQIQADTAIKLQGTERFTGQRAAEIRRRFEEPEERNRKMETDLSQIFTGVKLSALEFSDLAKLEVPVHYTYAAAVPQHGRKEGDAVVIPATLFRHQLSAVYAQLPERRTDLVVEHPWTTRNTIEYELPKGAKIKALPAGGTIDSKHVRLEQSFRRTAKGFESDDTVTIKSFRIPSEDYAEFRQACLRIDRALSRKVEMTW